MFFVVSGYLITSLILPDISAGRFSIIEFYERRIRRLFPALFVVMAVCLAVSSWLLLPEDLRRFGGSLFATSFFSSNIFFWLETGYFQTAAEYKPLLHTWSLAVEEQFYLVFPPLLMLAVRYQRHRLATWTVGLLVLSLAASEWTLGQAPSAAFYLAPFRAWELATGVLLALDVVPAVRSRTPRALLAWLGLGLIAWSVYALSWRSPFPGFHALAPCVGAALIVWSGTRADTLVKRMLSLRPIAFVGLISYSLYLWHWPILAFARYYAVRELTGAERIGLLAISALLAVLSWRYIERPFRRRGGVLERRSLFRAAASVIAGSAALGLLAVFAQGWPQRLDGETTRLLAGARDFNPRRDECSALEAQDVLAGRACRMGVASAAAPSFILWGDSHADALMTVFDRLAVAHGVSGLYLGRIGCPPLLGVDRPGTDFHCRAFNDVAREAITASGTRTVVLVARWAHYSSEPIYGQEPRTRVVISEGDAASADVRHNDAVLADGLKRTLESLKGYSVFVVSAVPEVGYEVPEALARIHYLGGDVDIRPGADDYRRRQHAIEEILDREQHRFGYSLLRPAQALCDSDRCRVASGSRTLYVDSHHLSTYGATLVAEQLEPIFSR